MNPKDKDPITTKVGLYNRFKCSEVGCDEEYIGESARTLQKGGKRTSEVPLSHS